jgi:hypothetical protein
LHWNGQQTATGGGRGYDRQRPWFLVWFYKKNRRDVELAHILVLDGNFLQKGTIAIFIVTVMSHFFSFLFFSAGRQYVT